LDLPALTGGNQDSPAGLDERIEALDRALDEVQAGCAVGRTARKRKVKRAARAVVGRGC
jgi:hypothetical protein